MVAAAAPADAALEADADPFTGVAGTGSPAMSAALGIVASATTSGSTGGAVPDAGWTVVPSDDAMSVVAAGAPAGAEVAAVLVASCAGSLGVTSTVAVTGAPADVAESAPAEIPATAAGEATVASAREERTSRDATSAFGPMVDRASVVDVPLESGGPRASSESAMASK
ncbi:MAG TPA: hypothetical protein VFG79_10040 [Solirubrobacter sp.]|nr:hypothetical protein [Solirubrobacter sp.]